MGSYTKKILEVRVSLASGGFSSGNGQNTKILRLATDVVINKPGGEEKPTATIKITNVPPDDMEQLTFLAFEPLERARNVVAVYAGDENGLSLAFSGDITSAVPEFAPAPDPVLTISAVTGYEASIKAIQPTTGGGEQDAVAVLQRLAGEAGVTLTNRGASAKLRNICLMGGPLEQARAIAHAARLELIIDDAEWIISPRGALREDDNRQNTPVWGLGSGLIGYPAYDQQGLTAKGIYEPRLKIGGPIRIDSTVPKASGLWRVTSLEHHLQYEIPNGGAWETSVKMAHPNAKDAKKGKK